MLEDNPKEAADRKEAAARKEAADRTRSADQRSYAASSGEDAPAAQHKADDAPDVATRRRRDTWYAAAVLCLAVGAWGLIGGWYFGLPLGGETHDYPIEKPWQLSDLLKTIPHPGLSRVPLVRDADGYRRNEAYQNGFTWTSQTPDPVRLGGAKAADRDGASTNVTVGQSQPAPEQKKDAPASLVYSTNLQAAARIVIPPVPSAQKSHCVSFAPKAGSVSCLAIPLGFPRGRAVGSSNVMKTVEAEQGLFFRLTGGQVQNLQALVNPADESIVVGLLEVASRAEGPTPVSAMTIGSEPSASPAAGGKSAPPTPVVWIGSYNGAIYKITPRSESLVTVTAFDAPTTSAIELIFFVSEARGWAIARFNDSSEREWLKPVIVQTSDGGATWQRLWYRWLPAPWVFVAFLVGTFAFERGTRAQLAMRPAAAKQHITDHGVSDDPIGLDDADALGLVPIANAMSRFIRNTQTKPTVSFAVTGPWGSGKTSLMNLVRQDLSDRGVCTVWFNAWHYQKEDNLLAALLAAIRAQAIAPIWTPVGISYRIRVGLRRFAQDPAPLIALIVVAVFGALLFWKYGGDLFRLLQGFFHSLSDTTKSANDKDSFAQFLAAVGLSTTGLGGLLLAGKKLWDLFKPLKSVPGDLLASLKGASSTGDLDQQLSFRYRFAKEYATFCDVLRWPPNPGLVIFVDDLDRCDPRQTVDVLEAINFVTSAGKCFVVLGFDESKVKAAVADHYKGIILKIDDVGTAKDGASSREDLINFASRYLEKLVHLVIPVPAARRDTVEALLGVTPLSAPSPKERRWRRFRRTIVESVAALLLSTALVSGAWLTVDVLMRLVSPAVTNRAEPPAQPSAGGGAGGGNTTTTPPPAEPATPFLTPAQLDQSGLLSDGGLALLPPSMLITAFFLIIGLLGAQYVPRLFLAEPVVDDSPEFKTAMSIWVDAVSRRRNTPRDVKRFVNRLRFLAMRLRDVSQETTLSEAKLVSFAAIEDLDAGSLGRQPPVPAAPTAEGEIASLVRQGADSYRSTFGTGLYDSPDALQIYRRIAGLVEERGGDPPSAAAPHPPPPA